VQRRAFLSQLVYVDDYAEFLFGSDNETIKSESTEDTPKINLAKHSEDKLVELYTR